MPVVGNGTDLLAEALRLCDRGFWVVPCDGKKAVVEEWGKARLTKKQLVAKLKGTRLNIAVALNQSALIDLECDSSEAEAALRGWFGGEVPPTPTWKSSRGRHRLFRRPDGLSEKAKFVVDGVEVRGAARDRGAVSVVPPSTHPDGTRYEWLPGLSLYEVEPAALPPEVVERLRAPAPKAAPATDDAPEAGDIPEGKRNDELFRRACALTDLKLPAAVVLKTLLDLNEKLCKPPLPEAEVRAIAASAAKGKPRSGGFLARLLDEMELWHDETDEPCATVPVEGHRETWRVDSRSKPFRRWLAKRWFEATGGEVLAAGGLADLAALLEGKAVFAGPKRATYHRVAGHEGKVYLDLGDPEWRAVEIDGEDWRVVAEPPVKFLRAKGSAALPEPRRPDRPLRDLLKPFVNVAEEEWPLVVAWLAAALRPTGPYPILKLLGEQGSTKTTTAKVLVALIDPNTAPVRAEPTSLRDLMIAATNRWVLCFDNLSSLSPWLSDALCRLSTGGGSATRTLYADAEECIFQAMRPQILTSIEEIGARSDLLERSLILDLPPIGEGKRRAEKAIWADFEAARPAILGALLDAVSAGLRDLPAVEAKADAELGRMADFEQWARACEGPLGLAPGSFAEAYAANREVATQTVLESNPAIAALLRLLESESVYEQTATNLLTKLEFVTTDPRKQPGWPKTPRVLSAILKRAAPNLRQVGIVATQGTRGRDNAKEKVWRIEKTAPGPEGAGEATAEIPQVTPTVGTEEVAEVEETLPEDSPFAGLSPTARARLNEMWEKAWKKANPPNLAGPREPARPNP
jgi:hypothetical protein